MLAVKCLILLAMIIAANLSDQCGTPVPDRSLVASLVRGILPSAGDGSPDPNVLLTLRLARQHDLKEEAHLLRELKRNVLTNGSELSTGTIALHTMALLASCDDPLNVMVEDQQMNLVALLMDKLKTDIDGTVYGDPLTHYYQISLAVLALCKSSTCLPCQTIEMIFCSAAHRSIQEEFTYSTEILSIAALALRCMSIENCECQMESVMSALGNVVERILSHIQSDGTTGDVGSTGLAIQALSANPELVPLGSWDCQLSMEGLLEGIYNGTFDNPQILSLVVPALENRTFLDVDRLNCSMDIDDLPVITRGGPIMIDPADATRTSTHSSPILAPHLSGSSPMSSSPARLIRVNYTVMEAVFNKFTHSLVLTVPLGSSVLDVMMEAHYLSPAIFRPVKIARLLKLLLASFSSKRLLWVHERSPAANPCTSRAPQLFLIQAASLGARAVTRGQRLYESCSSIGLFVAAAAFDKCLGIDV
ncbi:cobalamin binding intrinsic factor-like [Hemiscyllium ocellatum]|uniref:cobalamin binding intrinsic factor-like n=1 Tax=Hemiscyllium ocellatum TaxID=170820 RepID=UPI00296659AB|nr:cobalamin binding intrinsic factor-like [Hemiscyllium ocellatum]